MAPRRNTDTANTAATAAATAATAATAAATAATAADADDHADSHAREPILPEDRILGMVESPPVDDLMAEGGDLPLLSWEEIAEKKGGDLTDTGFASLKPGFEVVGFVLGTKKVPSDYGTPQPVMDANGSIVRDGSGNPVMQKQQDVYLIKGTARMPVKGVEGQLPKISGRLMIPCYARLAEPIKENMATEEKLTAIARKKNRNAPRVRIPILIRYIGQGPDREENGEKKRSGAHLFEVRRVVMVDKNATRETAAG